jgi:PEP-CTERM motif
MAFFALSVAMSARADTMWTLTAGGAVCGPVPCTGVTFNDGATATGSFVIPSSASSATLDVADLLSTTFDIKTTDGQNTPHIIGFEYDNANSTATYTPGFGPFGGPYADEVLFASNDGKHFLQLLLPTGTTYDLATTTGTHVLSEGLTGSVSNELGICSNVADDSTITLCANSASSDFRDVVSGALNGTTLGGGSPPPPPTVPEPGTLPLLATGLAALAAVGLKKGLLAKVA